MGHLDNHLFGPASRLMLGLLLIAAGSPGQQSGQVVFTADVSLVSLPVTVKDAHGAPVGGLRREDFSILENGKTRPIAVFERRTNRSLSVALMLDVSLSTAVELRYEKESAGRFLERLLGPDSQAGDTAAVFSFSSAAEVLADFTHDAKRLAAALGRVRPETGTSVYDAIQLASAELEKRAGRRVIVIITDGGDTTSTLKFADALRAAHAAEAAIYPLIVLPIQSDAGRNRGGEHALITLAQNTGGEAFVQSGARDLDAAFGEVLRNLRTQYLLGYYPEGDDLSLGADFRNVQVRVARAGAVVLARSGYFAERPRQRSVGRRPVDAPVRLRTRPHRGVPEAEEPEAKVPAATITRPPRRTRDSRTPRAQPGP